MSLELLGKHACFGGEQRFYAHQSSVLGCRMRFSLYLPPAASQGPVAGLTYLAGLTCTEETFVIKAGAQRMAAKLGMALLAPDTSPRGLGLSGEDDDWDFGSGAGFYLDATQEPWSGHYRMYSYVIGELRELVMSEFPIDPGRQGIFGHSMGGHGALTIGLKHPELYRSISAFAPICAPSLCPWGQKAFSNYLGDDRSEWDACDASVIASNLLDGAQRSPLLVDQGMADQFLEEQLFPESLEAACRQSGLDLNLRRHEGYDHSYYFISSFMEDHLRHHAGILGLTE
jgi:S-formylglutathione hydrolase